MGEEEKKKVANYVYNTEKCDKHLFIDITILRIFPLNIEKCFEKS